MMMTHLCVLFVVNVVDHDDESDAVFVHETPEVHHGVGQRGLSQQESTRMTK